MRIVFLVGGRGAGKTTVGRALAAGLGCAFADTDALVCRRAGAPVADIVAAEGWPGFRARESAALREAASLAVLPATPGEPAAGAGSQARAGIGPLAVVATGGGMVLEEENRRYMRAHGLVFWLDVSPGVAAARLAARPLAGQRPALTSGSLDEEVRAVLRERRALYAASAHHRLDADAPADTVCARITRLLAGRREKNQHFASLAGNTL